MFLESRIRVLGSFPVFSQDEIREEQSQARVKMRQAKSGGPVHRCFIEALPKAWQNDPSVEIFSRLLWLKQGWYPLSPHFHFDWGRDAASNREEPTVVETIMVCLGDASLTEFILGSIEHPYSQVKSSEKVVSEQRVDWDSVVSQGIAAGRLKRWSIQPNQLVWFDNRTLHRARPAVKTGWRLLVRAIRGLKDSDGFSEFRSAQSKSFTSVRNNYIPENEEQKQRYAPYLQ